MIEELTSEQVEKLAVYRDKWIQIGLCCDPVDIEAASPAIKWLYNLVGRDEDVPVLLMGSPLSAGRAANHIVAAMSEGKTVDEAISGVDDYLNSNPKERVQQPYLWGQFDAGYHSHYDYMENVLGIPLPEIHHYRYLCNLGPIWALEAACVVSDRPEHLKMVDGQLHCDGGPSFKYRDGFCGWHLNGVSVPQWLAETPAMEIEPVKFARLDNVEVRREFVRKVGMERIIDQLEAKSIDTAGDYELLEVDLGGETGVWPYLKMRNPSIGVWHLECVEKGCKTVQEAINFRASRLKGLDGDWNPEVLT